MIRKFFRNSILTKWLYNSLRRLYSFKWRVYKEKKLLENLIKADVHNPHIRELRNSFLGERCFIVCNGPSLTIEDLNRLKNEYCFTMNSIINSFDRTVWRPKFYGIQDKFVYEKIEEKVNTLCCDFIFISEDIKAEGLKCPKNSRYFNILRAGHDADNNNPYFNFSSDCSIAIFDGYSITYSLLQIACYLGFKEIYLIGCDCSYSKEPSKQHFSNSGHVDPDAYRIGAKMIEAFKVAKKYCDANSIKVYNATRGGALDVFPRVNIDTMELK